MLDKVKQFISRFMTWVRSIRNKQPLQPTPSQHVVQQVPEWMDEVEVDPIDESVWESFPASDPPAYTLEDRT